MEENREEKRNNPGFDPVEIKQQEYEELLIRKETALKDAHSYEIDYTKEFGELIADILKTKIECIRLRKTISFCQKAINQGKKVDVDAMKKTIDEQMAGYYVELDQLLFKNEAAKDARQVADYIVREAKRIYRRIVKVLHPDINAKTEKIQRLKELWNDVTEAYDKYDVDRLEDLEVLVNRAIRELGDEGFELNIKNLDKKIERLEKQISDIVTNKPYTYIEILRDKEAVKAHREELEKELKEYESYASSLEEELNNILSAEGGTFIWRMN